MGAAFCIRELITGGMLRMKKIMSIGLMAVLVAGVAVAQNDVVMVDQGQADAGAVEVTAEAALLSAYVWRGQVLNNDFVIQPQLTMAKNGLSFNVWGNYDLIRNYNDSDGDFSEIDLSVAYTLPIDINEMAFDVGVISYNFPNNGTVASSPSTTELFASATIQSWKDYVIPSVTLFGDIDEAEGIYLLFDIVAPYQVSDYLSVEGGFSAGWGSSTYNSAYFTSASEATQGEGFNDFNFYGVASYEVAENLTASVNATYTALEGGSIRNAASENYEASEKLWFGVNVAYDF
jgi:hypothetical protein